MANMHRMKLNMRTGAAVHSTFGTVAAAANELSSSELDVDNSYLSNLHVLSFVTVCLYSASHRCSTEHANETQCFHRDRSTVVEQLLQCDLFR
jgi:fumarate reductase subunit D